MNTEIKSINEAIKHVQIWFSNTSMLHQGNKLFNYSKQATLKETEFAKWYYGRTAKYESIEAFKIIEKYYNECYEACLSYKTMYNSPVKTGLFVSKSKRANELNHLIFEFQEKTNKLIKSIEFFRKRLQEILSKKESSPKHPSIVNKEKSNTIVVETSKKSEQEIDYEKKLYEEVAKVKKQLEDDYSKKMEQEKTKIDNPIFSVSDPIKPNSDTDIDIDEEMRRILS